MDRVVVAELESPHEAVLARGLLRAHGIPAETHQDGEVLPATVTGRVSGTAVVVPAALADQARALLPDPTPGPLPGATSDLPPGAVPGPRARAGPGPDAGPGPPAPGDATPLIPSVTPLAATRASRPRWALAAVVLLVALVGWLLLEASGALGMPITAR